MSNWLVEEWKENKRA